MTWRRVVRVKFKFYIRQLRLFARRSLRALMHPEIEQAKKRRKLVRITRTQSLTSDSLFEYAKQLATTHHSKVLGRPSGIYRRFAHHCAEIAIAHRELEQASQQKEGVTPGAEWLLDNYHLVQQQIADIKRHFPRKYDQTLPKLLDGPYATFPRAYHIAVELLKNTDAVVNVDLLSSFIRGYQATTVLTMGELWAIPIMLRFALIENLSLIAERMLLAREERRAAAVIMDVVIGDESRAGTHILQTLTTHVAEHFDLLMSEASYVTSRLREVGRKASLSLQWLDERLREENLDQEEIVRNEQYLLAADQVWIGNTVNSLRTTNIVDWKDWFESVNQVDKILRDDPALCYARCDFKTRDRYRGAIEKLAKGVPHGEVGVAERVVEYAAKQKEELLTRGEEGPAVLSKRSHVGYYLVDKGRPALEKAIGYVPRWYQRLGRAVLEHAFSYYSGSIVVVTLLLLAQIALYATANATNPLLMCATLVLALIPASDLATNIIQLAITRIIAPDLLPKLDFTEGVPESCRTLVVVQAIFSDVRSVRKTVDTLEVRFLANKDPHVRFGILADLGDAAQEQMPNDREIIERATGMIEDLKKQYGPDRFFILFRRRLWNEGEGKFMGWERKRGKIEEFNRLLLGEGNTTFIVTEEQVAALKNHPYVVTLDNDSQLPRGVVRKLVGTIAHPLNEPIYDAARGKVTEGYSIIQPRVGMTLVSAHASLFARIFSGQAGLDPYTQTVSEVYQDLFHQGSFVGKGIYKVAPFEQSLRNKVPENAILSHDLFEGLFARVALATDVELFDDYPAKYHVHTRRQLRWARGDWQLLPWIFGKIPNGKRHLYPTPLSPLDRWKLLDNLRRSLVAPMLFFLLIFSWSLVAPLAFGMSILGALVIAFPVFANLTQAFMIPARGISLTSHVRGMGRDVFNMLKQAIFTLCFLPHQAALMLEAMLVTLRRLLITKKHMLEWETAYHSEHRLGHDLNSFMVEMKSGLVLTGVGLVATLIFAPQSLAFGLPFFVLWFASPLVAYKLSEPIPQQTFTISDQQRAYLYSLGYKSWRYFRDFMKPERNYLVPDNVQFVPSTVVADRTSVTNISLSVISTISAYDCGFLSLPKSMELLSQVFVSLKKLERFHGHLLNWYNIRTLEPLYPKYISMVDSGNLVGHFVAAAIAFQDFETLPFLSERHVVHVRSLLDRAAAQKVAEGQTLAGLRDCLAEKGFSLRAQLKILQEIAKAEGALKQVEERWLREGLGDVLGAESYLHWVTTYDALRAVAPREEAQELFQEIDRALESEALSLLLLGKVSTSLRQLTLKFEKSTAVDAKLVEGMNAEIRELNRLLEEAKEARRFLIKESVRTVKEVDFTFLYDYDRDLFAIGYDVGNARRDGSYYDLLASEARLGSLVAIAQGQVPQQHWFSLGRPLTDSPGGKVLLSWSGTMFEYLMPILVTKNFGGTLLSETYSAAVRSQIAYGRSRGVPWGISESGYSGVDFEKTYQYRAFGVPGLGLKRGLEEDLVVSPYSTILALSISFDECMNNLHALEREGLAGEYGFYEAIDYTESRLSGSETSHIVRSYLAHHQGMNVVAINNLLHDGIFQERFHRDQQIRTTELLLHEKFPDRVPLIAPKTEHLFAGTRREEEPETITTQIVTTPHTSVPLTHLLSNGRYSVMLDNAGSGVSTFERDLALTRWREDPIRNNYGTYLYIRDLNRNLTWSTTYQPTLVAPEAYEVIFGPDKVEYKRRDHEIFLHTEITISPEDNVEIRKVSLTNLSKEIRQIDFTSYGEVVLYSARGDAAHPAFAKMFVESSFIEDLDCLLFSRRPRSKKEEPLHFFHMVTMRTVWDRMQFDTSRFTFLGRGNTVYQPQSLAFGQKLSGQAGYVLDPIFSLRTKLELEPGQTEVISFINGFSKNKEELIALAQRYKHTHQISRAFEMAWSQSSVELRNERIAANRGQVFQRLGNALLFNVEKARAKSDILVRNRLAQSGLWRFGISGDYPIVLLRISEANQMKLVQELLTAHHYLRLRGLTFDLVILNEFPGGYFQHLQEEIEFLARASFSGGLIDKHGGVYLRTVGQLSEDERTLLSTVARVVLSGLRGNLASQLKFDETPHDAPPVPVRTPTAARKTANSDGEFFNDYGSFIENGKAYALDVQEGLPPLPWSNIVANRSFGFLVTEGGGGYTWSENSRENRLSPWTNDPVSDVSGEALYIRTVKDGEFWSATPSPARADAPYRVEHHFGASIFRTSYHDVETTLTVSVSPDEKAKWWRLEITNKGRAQKELEVVLYIEWVLGVMREESNRYLCTAFDLEAQALYTTNYYNGDFAGRVVSIGSSEKISSYTTSRAEFLGRNRDLAFPIFFAKKATGADSESNVKNLSSKVGAGFDTCGALKVDLKLKSKQNTVLHFYMSEASSLENMRRESTNYRKPAYCESQIQKQRESMQRTTSAITVRTPERSFDLLMNGWLLYQTLACRLYGRTGLYQSGGAFGFRDQLQDVMALLYSEPVLTRQQIVLHASRQFQEGDVQHWWHPPSGKGVRTKISDDYLWLPFVTKKYVDVTGDKGILDERVSFISGPLLGEHEHEAYIVPHQIPVEQSVYEHCLLAIEHGLRFGSHGLPLMGVGDWNDGMNEVGKDGKGESVWLAWFLIATVEQFLPLIEARGDTERVNRYRSIMVDLKQAIELHAWDGRWYRRAYFDDGTPLGSDQNDECKIDSISQTWGIISGAADPERAKSAMEEVNKRLVNSEDKIIALLAPPFNQGMLQPGYIKGYVPGIRENGGQYTHAATWLIIAHALQQHGSEALRLLNMINPINHTKDKHSVDRYRAEPYVLCGDVYAVPPHTGRAGWSWYTGSAGWVYQAGVEYIIGLKVHPDHFTCSPCVPATWKEFGLDYKRDGTTYKISVDNDAGVEHGVKRIEVNGSQIDDLKIYFEKYRGQQEVAVRVVMG